MIPLTKGHSQEPAEGSYKLTPEYLTIVSELFLKIILFYLGKHKILTENRFFKNLF